MSALAWIQSYLQPDCWKWQQDDVVEENGAKLRTTIDWPLAIDAHRPLRNIDYWLHRLDPEIAVVMWGSNDSLLPIGGFAGKLRAVVVAIKSNGTIPVLTTIPPRQGRVKETTRIAEMIREVARTEHVPLIDYQGAILARAPNGSWNGADVFQKGGANAQTNKADPYDVPRLIAGDGIHPSNPKASQRRGSTTRPCKRTATCSGYRTLRTLTRSTNAFFDPPVRSSPPPRRACGRRSYSN